MCTPNFLLGEGLSLLPNFLKGWEGGRGGGGLTGFQCLEGDGWERKGWPFSYGLKYLIAKKVYKQSFFLSLISNNLKWEILTNNLATFKGSDGVKDEKFKYYKGLLKNPIFKGGFHKKPLCIAENCLKLGAEGLDSVQI